MIKSIGSIDSILVLVVAFLYVFEDMVIKPLSIALIAGFQEIPMADSILKFRMSSVNELFNFF